VYIYEIVLPGTWLDYEDKDWSWKIEGLLRHLEGQFYEANLTMNMFLHSLQVNKPKHSKEQWDADSQRRIEIRQLVEEKYGGRFNHENWESVQSETEILFKREQWQAGRLPREFEHNQPFIYARSFLYAIDSFDKFLKVLSATDGVPSEISTQYDELGKAFPALRGVRNTAQHMEDRARGLGAGTNPKPLDLKPIDNNMVKAPGGVLMLNCLNGTKYGNTMADGHYGEVDVSPSSMDALHAIFQQVIALFKWKGSQRHLPSL
jgi:hypothetical protein